MIRKASVNKHNTQNICGGNHCSVFRVRYGSVKHMGRGTKWHYYTMFSLSCIPRSWAEHSKLWMLCPKFSSCSDLISIICDIFPKLFPVLSEKLLTQCQHFTQKWFFFRPLAGWHIMFDIIHLVCERRGSILFRFFILFDIYLTRKAAEKAESTLERWQPKKGFIYLARESCLYREERDGADNEPKPCHCMLGVHIQWWLHIVWSG